MTEKSKNNGKKLTKMASKSQKSLVEVPTVQGEVIPPPRIGPLNSLKGVANELRRLYRRTARGESPVSELGTRTNTLHVLAKVPEMSDTDAELRAMRQALERAGVIRGR